MPEPVNKNAIVPAGFDPEKHCGATTRSGVLCIKPAGWGVPDLSPEEMRGRRCKLHGGASAGRPIKHGLYSGRLRATFEERIEEIRRDPALRSLDIEIATAKAALEMEIERYQSEMDSYDMLYEAYIADPANVPAPRAPHFSIDVIDTIGRLIKTDHDIAYGRKYSVPLRDLQAAFVQIQSAFDSMCMKYGIDDKARQEFAKALMAVKLPGHTMEIEGEYEGAA